MRKTLLIITSLIISLSIFSATGEGVGKGYKDEIKVSVEKQEGKISSIKIISSNETKRIGEPAMEKLTKAIIEKQTVEVDNIAGATYTSLGFKEAVKNAIENIK